MIFTHDTEIVLRAIAALVNTDPAHRADEADLLATTVDLDAFVDEWEYTGSRTHDNAELDAVRSLRGELRELWTAAEDEQVAGINGLLVRERALPQLVRHDGWGWHLHATTAQSPLAQRIAVEAAMALIDVVRTDERSRLRTCAADDCENILVDLARNRSRRYCEDGCGNRAAVAAYRARNAER